MATPPRTKNLKVEDVQDPESLTRNLNQFLNPTYQALSKGLTFSENLKAQWHTTEPLYVPDDWVALSLVDGWQRYSSNYTSPQIRKDRSGQVHLRGLVRSATLTSPTPVASLPATYLPEYRFITPTVASDALGWVSVYADGQLRATGTFTTYFSLEGVSWTAADRTPIPAGCFPYDFRCDFKTKPAGVFLADGGALGTPDWEFIFKNGAEPYVRIKDVPGLPPNASYELTFLVVAS